VQIIREMLITVAHNIGHGVEGFSEQKATLIA